MNEDNIYEYQCWWHSYIIITRCRCKLRHVPKFTAASRGPPCDSTASCFLYFYVTYRNVSQQLVQPISSAWCTDNCRHYTTAVIKQYYTAFTNSTTQNTYLHWIYADPLVSFSVYRTCRFCVCVTCSCSFWTKCHVYCFVNNNNNNNNNVAEILGLSPYSLVN